VEKSGAKSPRDWLRARRTARHAHSLSSLGLSKGVCGKRLAQDDDDWRIDVQG
jgi:hypothetical protein